MIDLLIYAIECAINPSSVRELSVYYLIWISTFLSINITWDVVTPNTPRFHFSNLKGKITTLYAAATFSSSFLLILSLFSEAVVKLVGDTLVPLILAGMTGILCAISELCPYTPQKTPTTKQ